MKIQIEEAYCGRKTNKLIKIASIIFIILLIVVCSCVFIFLPEQTTPNNIQAQNQINEEEKQPKIYIPQLTEEGMENINHIYSSDEKIAYLTFDDGPSIDVTEMILDVLKENDITATFFVLGSRAEQYPDIIKREYEEGHYIANHGYSHEYDKLYKSANSVLEEYEKTEKIIAKILDIEGYKTHLFRFPGGSVGGYDRVKKEAKKLLNENNIAYLDWNSLTRDSEAKFTKEQLFNNFKATIKNKNSIVILNHDANGKILTYEVIKDIILYLKEAGYKFGDMRDLMV